MDSNTLLIIFVGFTGFAVLMQACVLFGIYFSLRKAAKSVAEVTGDLKATVLPLVHSSRDLMERISPQVMTLTAGLADLTELVNKESKSARVSVSEVLERVNRQAARVDAMLTVGLDTVERTATALETSVAGPVRQANGVMAAIKAMIQTYRTTPSRSVQLRREAEVHYPDPDQDIAL